jgi:hypothetical protein
MGRSFGKEEKACREEDVILSTAKQSEQSLDLSFVLRRLVIFAPTADFSRFHVAGEESRLAQMRVGTAQV